MNLCWLGFNPMPSASGSLTCLDGSSPNPAVDINNLAPPTMFICESHSPLSQAANCPQGWALLPWQDGPVDVVFCQPTLQEQACLRQGMDLGLNGTCQHICGPSELTYPTTQCCPAGMIATANGQCACPAGEIAAEDKCVPQSKVCPEGEVEVDGKCRREPKGENKKSNSQLCPDGTPVPSDGACPQPLEPACPSGEFPGPDGNAHPVPWAEFRIT